MVAIFSASAQPDLAPPEGLGLSDKQAHTAAYGGLGALVARALAGGFGAPLTGAQALSSVAMTTAYGGSDEFHQAFVPGRQPDLRDVWADAVGAVLGTAACWAWGIIRSRSDV